MKHPITVTTLLIIFFFISQIVGLFIVQDYLGYGVGENISVQELPLGMERPQANEDYSFLYIFAGILIGTVLLLIIAKYKKHFVWKIWYFVAVLICLVISISSFLTETLAILFGLILASWKVLRPNVIVHNLTELFVYSALAVIFVPMLNLFSVSVLLIGIAIYDMIAVWKIKHMITLAEFQTESKLFAGLFIPKQGLKMEVPKKLPKSKKSMETESAKNSSASHAILGGGDIAFPLLFAGTILKISGMIPAIIISLAATGALMLLFMYSEKGKFYPAMPFLSVGCFVGFAITFLL